MKFGEVVVAGNVPFKQVSIQPELATPEVYEECAALLRFWRRRAYFCFVPADCPNGESDWSINVTHLALALERVAHYERLLSGRDSSEVKP